MTPFNRANRQAFTPLLTPFSGDGIDFASLEAAIDRQMVAGMDGIVVCDLSGEGATLTQAERDAMLEICVGRGRPHLSVIAAVGSNCTATTIEQCHRAEELGANALLVTIPYYSKPTLNGVVDHFRQITAVMRTPIIVDDDPGRTAIDYGPALLERLAEFDLIMGVSHGPDRIGYFARLEKDIVERFLHVSKDDRTLFQFLELGGNGAISPLANIIPSPIQTLVSMTESFSTPTPLAQNMMDAAIALGRDDVAALKEAASFIHLMPADVRLPLVGAEPETVVRIRHAFASFSRAEGDDQVAA